MIMDLKNFFFKKITVEHKVKSIKNRGWINIYDFFLQKKVKIWPRGLPLDEIQKQNNFRK